MYNVKLVVIFNHNYEQHIPTLEALYAKQFPNRCYLVPFSRSGSNNVIPVHEGGQTFSGHVAQAHKTFKSPDVTHYLFIADDMLLNPSICSSTLHSRLQLESDEAYIKNLAPISEAYYLWLFGNRILQSAKSATSEYSKHFPPPVLATKRLAALGLECGPINRSMLRSWDGRIHFRDFALSPLAILGYLRARSLAQSYPLVFGYSDLFVIPAADLDQFAHFCGVLGAMNMFAEVAIPTAMALACGKITSELSVGEVFQRQGSRKRPGATMHGTEYWGADISGFEQRFNGDLTALLDSFPVNQLYVHPVKLSRWSLNTRK